MKDKGDNPIVGSETTDIYDGENHGYKENNSLEKDDLEAFATIWTVSTQIRKCGYPDNSPYCGKITWPSKENWKM